MLARWLRGMLRELYRLERDGRGERSGAAVDAVFVHGPDVQASRSLGVRPAR